MSTPDTFQASVTVEGAGVQITAPSINVLSALLARLTSTQAKVGQGVSAAEKAAVVGNAPTPTAAPTPQPTAAPKPQATPAPSPPTAAAGAGGAQGGVTYDDVKKVVTALYAIQPKHAEDALAKFGVKNGKDLDPSKWVEFVEAARAQLESLKAPA